MTTVILAENFDLFPIITNNKFHNNIRRQEISFIHCLSESNLFIGGEVAAQFGVLFLRLSGYGMTVRPSL
jgi:hypothetical protein